MATTSPLPVPADFLMIGGGIAAATAAETLRDEGAKGTILMLCAERYRPYNRPQLTSGILLGNVSPAQALLRQPDAYREDEIDIRLETIVRSVDPARHEVTDQNGTVYRYGKLLIATGTKARRLDVPGADLQGIYCLHTMADALAIRDALDRLGGPVVIIGSSFIAMETATSLSRRGIAVTLVDHADEVFPTIHSPHLAAFFLERCTRHGVDVRLRQSITAFHGDQLVSAVLTQSGDALPCRTVIVAIGVEPQTGFLDGSGIACEDGVLVDKFLRTGRPDVFAAGDAANYPDAQGHRRRTEHWDNARQQGVVAARNMLNRHRPYHGIPHYFCDFLDFSFTFLGESANADTRIERGLSESGSFAEIYLRENRIIGLFSTGRSAEEIHAIEMLIQDRSDVSGALGKLSDPAADLRFLTRTTVLILQGGGALGAFECGVVRALDEARIAPGIIGGVSIGAVNGAIIAANPRNAFQALESFWDDLGVGIPSPTPDKANALAVWSSMMFGVPGYFRPRWSAPWIGGEMFPFQWTSLYDASPFAKLLEKYIDFPSLAASPIRLIVGAVDVELGELRFFDSHVDIFTTAHILASCSLPPIFRATEIDGRHYWDGGIISNSPLGHVLSVCGGDNKDVVVVDLFPGERRMPTNLSEVVIRCEEITYGERIRKDAHMRELVHDYRTLISEIMIFVDPEAASRLKEHPGYIHLMGQGAANTITRIVRDGRHSHPPAWITIFRSKPSPSTNATATRPRGSSSTHRPLVASKARGLCPRTPAKGRALRSALIKVCGGRGNAPPRPMVCFPAFGGRITPPSANLALMGSKGSALSGGSKGAKPPWPYLRDHAARLSIRSVTTPGSARVDVSPRLSVSLAAILRRMRRMILPDCGSWAGRAPIGSTSGEAIGPISRRTQATSSLRKRLASAPHRPLQRDIGVDALALQVVREADDGGLGHFRMGDQRAFDLGGAHAVAGDVDHVIDAAGDPVIAVLVAPGAVAGEIEAGEGGEIGLDEALVVAVDVRIWPGQLSPMQRLPSPGAFQLACRRHRRARARRRAAAGWRSRALARWRRAAG